GAYKQHQRQCTGKQQEIELVMAPFTDIGNAAAYADNQKKPQRGQRLEDLRENIHPVRPDEKMALGAYRNQANQYSHRGEEKSCKMLAAASRRSQDLDSPPTHPPGGPLSGPRGVT